MSKYFVHLNLPKGAVKVYILVRKNYNLEDILAGTLNITRNAKKLREKVRGILQILAKQHGVKVSAKI